MKLILGSKSFGRRQILNELGYKFSIIDPNIDEKSIRHDNPENLVVLLAQAKAQAILSKTNEEAILITADQVVRCNNKILEKPRDHNEAYDFLQLHMQYPTETITGIVVTNTTTKEQCWGIDIAKIWFQKIPTKLAKQIANQEYVIHCAGGFSLDDPLITKHISKIQGTKDSITGLPIKLTLALIEKISPDGTAG